MCFFSLKLRDTPRHKNFVSMSTSVLLKKQNEVQISPKVFR